MARNHREVNESNLVGEGDTLAEMGEFNLLPEKRPGLMVTGSVLSRVLPLAIRREQSP